MRLRRVVELLNVKLLAGSDQFGREVEHALSSDLMSEILTASGGNVILLTGLSDIQSLRTAEMNL